MDYPVWQPGFLSKGLFIALIATVHVLIAQLAVGGGFFLLATEYRALRERSLPILDWLTQLSKIFLLLSMVFGSLTGVAIWAITSLVSPEGINVLINQFHFFWAVEWVFFFGEIVALFLYAGHFKALKEGRVSPRVHLTFGWAYAIFSFFSLFFINGIISFMLTPGSWIHNHQIWSAFFNPTFWPSLFFRFCLCLMLAGLFGLLLSNRIQDKNKREAISRICAAWLFYPCIFLALSSVWYFCVLTDHQQFIILRKNSETRFFLTLFLLSIPFVLAGALALYTCLSNTAKLSLSIFMLCTILLMAASFEIARESARRPWLISNYLYSNGLFLEQYKEYSGQSLYSLSPWIEIIVETERKTSISPQQSLTEQPLIFSQAPDSFSSLQTASALQELAHTALPVSDLPKTLQMTYAEQIFRSHCSPCHGINGPSQDIVPKICGLELRGIIALLNAQGKINPDMPPFFGSAEDKTILAKWLYSIKSTDAKPLDNL